MGLLKLFSRFSSRTAAPAPGAPHRSRRTRLEQLEPRKMLAADVLLGGVYFEEATGDDSEADVIHVSFVGGPEGATLDRLVISGDKLADGLSPGDAFFDTEDGGLGAFHAVGYSLVAAEGLTVTGVSVVDGGTDIALTFSGFEAGDKLVFSIDVDETQFVDEATGDVDVNALVEGAEFQRSTMTGQFSAPGHVDLELTATYWDAFDARRDDAHAATSLALDLPDDRYESQVDKSDRTAGAVAHEAMIELATLSGYVYHDRNDDGARAGAPGEQGIAGVTLELLDASGDGLGVYATTDADGYYQFVDLHAGTYGVREAQPEGWFDGRDTAGSHGGDAGNDVVTGAVLEYGDDATDYNFGELLAGSIAGRVHASTGPDCDFDNPEILLEGVRIDLLDASGQVIDSTTTDVEGRYRFEGLAPRVEHQVRQHQPEGYYDGGERAGSAGGSAADDLITGVVLGSEQQAINYDFCEHVGADLSGYVYHDRSDDGLRAGGPEEPGIEGVTLELLDAAGTPLGVFATTNAAGYYEFLNLDAGAYGVREVQPSGWFDGKDTAGTHGGAAGDDVITGAVLEYGDQAAEYNFGELLAGSIAGRVHASTGPDCDFDNPEILLAGVRIDLLDASGAVVDTTTTDADGEYAFTGLRPGEYHVYEHQPEGYYDGDEHPGTAGGESDGDDTITGIRLGSDQDAVRYDFCEHVGADLSGYVYHDRDDDGLRTGGPEEPGIAGVTLELLDAAGTPLGVFATTNAAGYYEFLNLDAGAYGVREVQPSGWFDGKDTAGSHGGVAGDDVITGASLIYGDQATDYNFGELLAASISGRVHASTGPDCDFDNPEILLAGVQIDLLDASGAVVDTTTTDDNGAYTFTGLRPGEYQVREHQPSDYYDGGEHVGTAGGVASDDLISGIVVGSEQRATRYDFCEHVGASLSGYVYHDRDDDGAYDRPGEEAIAGVELRLLTADGADTGRRAVTDAGGYYQFSDLAPGTYAVQEIHPEGWLDGKDTPGSHGGESLASPPGDTIRQIAINFGDEATEYNFGELLPGSISGSVHVSTDPECDPHDGEPPIEGVVIELLNEEGEVVATTQTDADGEYSFTGLTPGAYTLREVQPEGYFNGDYHVGTGGGSFFGFDAIGDIHVGSDQHWEHYDFCETPPASISGYVFVDGAPIISLGDLDPNNVGDIRDGRRTSDDTPLAGVVLELRHGVSGDPIFGEEALPGRYDEGPIRTTTDANGFYEFAGLPAGTYAVVQVQPDDVIDGVDTPGSSGGQAVNPRAPLDGQVFPTDGPIPVEDATLEQFRTRFGNNAIIRIPLPVGENSVENNFSEVRTTGLLFPPERTPEPEPPVFGVANPPRRQLLLPPRLAAPDPDPIFGGSSKALGFTWHLSVVNGGQPRSAMAQGPTMRLAKAQFDAASWDNQQMDQAEWRLLQDDARRERVERFVFGAEDGVPVAGDWDGDGVTEIGVYIDGYWYLDLNGNGYWDRGDLVARLGSESDLPVTGDWDGDGKTDIGVYGPAWPRDPHAVEREPGLPDAENYPGPIAGKPKNLPPTQEDATSGARLLRRAGGGDSRADLIDHVFHFGTPGDAPVAGDWNGDGIRTIGVFRDGVWTLDTDGDGRFTDADATHFFGRPGDVPVVGDWDGDGVDDLGVYRAGRWLVDANDNRELDATDTAFELGDAGDTPIAGDWDGDGADEPAVYGRRSSEVRVSQKGE